jgi:hypothetical protein
MDIPALIIEFAEKDNMRENEYPVYPEDDGYDTYKNPYSPV